MTANGGRTVRIAHAYGNRRDKLDDAHAAEVDLIEVDVWYRAGDFWCRHERRARFLPLLYDQRPRGRRDNGPWALPVSPRHFIRPDLRPLRLSELLARTNGKRELLIDLKDEDLDERESHVVAEALVRALADAGHGGPTQVCGQTDLLDAVGAAGPHLDVRYSIQQQSQWEALLRRLDAGVVTRGLCLYHRFFDERIARFTADNGLQVYAWTIDDPARAREVVALGADGITSNSLSLLEAL
jgi:glycerophosphoryl diester phosphodiesterase